MNYKKVIVWSGGSANGKDAIFCAIGYFIIFILILIAIILSFIVNFNNNNNSMSLMEHIIMGSFFTALIGWLMPVMIYSSKREFNNFKSNKKIPLYLFNNDDCNFVDAVNKNIFDLKDKFVIFADLSGIVVAEQAYEKESKSFVFRFNSFNNIEKYCDDNGWYKL